jgi:hypothetical protein
VTDHLADLRTSLQEHLPNPGDDLGVLTGYVVIAQWNAGDGSEWLTKTAGDINDDGPAIWTIKGWLYHALETAQRDADAATGDDDEEST